MFNRILYATDLSNASKKALDYATYLANLTNSKLYILTVILKDIAHEGFYFPEKDFKVFLEETERNLSDNLDKFCRNKLSELPSYEKLIATGQPFEEIVKIANEEDIDLIILGTHGRTGIGRILLGSTAERVIRRAKCPVMVVRPE